MQTEDLNKLRESRLYIRGGLVLFREPESDSWEEIEDTYIPECFDRTISGWFDDGNSFVTGFGTNMNAGHGYKLWQCRETYYELIANLRQAHEKIPGLPENLAGFEIVEYHYSYDEHFDFSTSFLSDEELEQQCPDVLNQPWSQVYGELIVTARALHGILLTLCNENLDLLERNEE
ncbi:hypothetical protein ACQ4M3_09345 [Leptolyngbya sp. AN03gr2]|uniref:hypothetical protein n=1 Tax=Leptolyngbya sp. AN03gr2 TaxID=3423364 RepID=UPI003D3183B7